MNLFFKIFSKYLILVFTISMLGKTLSQKIPIKTDYQEPFLTSRNSLDNISHLKFLSTEKNTSNLKENFFTFIDGQTGYNSYLNTMGVYECYKVDHVKSGPLNIDVDLTKNFNINQLKFLITNDKKNPGDIDYKDTIFLNSDNNLDYSFPVDPSESQFYYFVKVTRIREFIYDPLMENILDESAKKLLDDSVQKNNQRFLDNCGDSVFTHVSEGGFLILGVNIKFESPQIKDKFERYIRNDIGELKSIVSFLKFNFSELGIKGRISFSVYGMGGDSQDFTNRIPNDIEDQCSLAVDPKNNNLSDENKYCTNFLLDFSSYLEKEFPLQFPDNSFDRFHTYTFRRLKLPDLNIPKPDVDEVAQLTRLKERILAFSDINQYYYSKMFNFLQYFPFNDELDLDFYNKFKEFFSKVKENVKNIFENNIRNFRFDDCWNYPKNCNIENFDNAYDSLHNNFNEINDLMFSLKKAWDYDLKLSDCSIGLFGGEIEVRIYPLWNNKYAIKYVDSNLPEKSVFRNGWEWIDGQASKINVFEFQVHPLLNHARAFANPIGDSKSLKINLKCGIIGTQNEGKEVDNPYYFDFWKI